MTPGCVPGSQTLRPLTPMLEWRRPGVTGTRPRLGSQTTRRPLHAYAVAAAAIGVTVSLTVLLRPSVEQSPFPLFIATMSLFPLYFAAVLVSVWYGGLGPGLFASALATVSTTYLFLPGSVSPLLGLADLVRAGVFLLVVLLTSSLISARMLAPENPGTPSFACNWASRIRITL